MREEEILDTLQKTCLLRRKTLSWLCPKFIGSCSRYIRMEDESVLESASRAVGDAGISARGRALHKMSRCGGGSWR